MAPLWKQRCVLLLGGFVFLGMLGRLSVNLASSNYNVASEATNLYGMLQVAEHKELYPKFDDKTVTTAYTYTPLSAVIAGTLMGLLPQSTLKQKVTLARLLNFSYFILILVLCWFTFFRPLNLSFFAIFLSCSLGLSKFSDYVTSARNDILSLLFDFSAFCIAVYWVRTKKNKYAIALPLFCLCAVLTRQSAITTTLGFTVWLLWEKQFKKAILFSLTMGTLILSSFYILDQLSSGGFSEHALLSHLLPMKESFVDLSILTFLASYALFVLLVLAEIRHWFRDLTAEKRLLIATLIYSPVLPSLQFFRVGGDVNYFFPTILIGLIFCASYFQRMLLAQANSKLHWMDLVFAFQVIVITVVIGVKCKSALKTGSIPFESIAERTRIEGAKAGLVFGGQLAPGLTIHLRGWTFDGPEITNAGNLAYLIKGTLGETLSNKIKQAFSSGSIQSILVIEPNCEELPRIQHPYQEMNELTRNFLTKKVLAKDFCLYSSDLINTTIAH